MPEPNTEPDYIVCPDCDTKFVEMENYRNHKPWCPGVGVRTGEPMDIAWQLLKAWPDPPEEGEKERLPVSHLPLTHPARQRDKNQAARTGGIEGLEGTMPPEFSSHIDEKEQYTEDFYDSEEKAGDAWDHSKELDAEIKELEEELRQMPSHSPEYQVHENDWWGRASDEKRDEIKNNNWQRKRLERRINILHEQSSEASDEAYKEYESHPYTPEGYDRPPTNKREMRPELEPFERDEALASEGAEMPDPHESEPPEGEPPESDLESAWKEITGSGGTAADELEEHLRPAEEKEQQAQEEESQLNEMARQMGEKAGDYFTESAEMSEPNTYANMTTDELKDAYIPMAQQYDSMSDEERKADKDFMRELEEVRQTLRSAEWEEGQNKPPTTESTRARPTRGGRRGNVKVQPRRGPPQRGE